MLLLYLLLVATGALTFSTFLPILLFTSVVVLEVEVVNAASAENDEMEYAVYRDTNPDCSTKQGIRTFQGWT